MESAVLRERTPCYPHADILKICLNKNIIFYIKMMTNIPPFHSLPATITKCTQRFLVDRMKFRSGKMTRTTGWLTRRHEGGWDVGQDPLSKWPDDTAGGNDNSSEGMKLNEWDGAWEWRGHPVRRFQFAFYTINWRLLRDCTCIRSSFALLQSWNSITPCAGAHTHTHTKTL